MDKTNKILLRLFPFIRWYPLKKGVVGADLIAGITIALVLIPQSMAYAQLAGMPPHYGLYAAFLPVIIAAMWGSSHHLSTGPVALTSLMVATVMVPFAQAGTEEFVSLAIFLSLLVGALRLLMGLFRLGYFLNLISHPVISGFTNAAALIIATSQINKLLGLDYTMSDFFLRDIAEVCRQITATHLPTLAVATGSIAVILGCKRFFPRLPSVLMAAILATGAIFILGIQLAPAAGTTTIEETAVQVYGIQVVGEIPSGLPKLAMPHMDLEMTWSLLPGAFMVMLIGFMEICSITRAISTHSHQRVDLNQELIGQGVSAIVGSFGQCCPTSGSFSRSALNFFTGGKTGMSSVFAGLFVLLTLLFLTPLLFYLPQATLAAIIIIAVLKLVDVSAMVRAWKVHWHDGLVAFFTFAATIFFAPDLVSGFLLGIGLAIYLHFHRSMKPKAVIADRHREDLKSKRFSSNTEIIRNIPKLYYDDSNLHFGNISLFEDEILEKLAQYPEACRIVILGQNLKEIDATGEDMLRNLSQRLDALGVKMVFVGLRPQVLAVLERTGLIALLGEENFFTSEEAALKAIEMELTNLISQP
ncbi:MAG: SulP family inorganic anion transporter [Planctomycetes bacterium]|nr:SulP family inorganic anion transporter [Planctomycetota bacterium]